MRSSQGPGRAQAAQRHAGLGLEEDPMGAIPTPDYAGERVRQDMVEAQRGLRGLPRAAFFGVTPVGLLPKPQTFVLSSLSCPCLHLRPPPRQSPHPLVGSRTFPQLFLLSFLHFSLMETSVTHHYCGHNKCCQARCKNYLFLKRKGMSP